MDSMKHYSTYQSQFIEMFKDSPKSAISDFCKVEKGSTITRNEVIDGDIPVVAGGQEPSCYHNVANRKPGVITVSASGAYSGFVNYWGTPIFASDCNTIIPIDEQSTNVHFLYHGLKTMQNEIYALQKGGAQPHVYGKDIEKVLFPCPTKDEQDKFADIAQQADKSKFTSLKSQFIEMFGDTPERVELSSLCDTFIDGDWIEAKDQAEDGIRLIQTGNVGVGVFKDKGDKARYISEDTFERLNCTEVKNGDILVSRLPDPVGRACIIPGGLGKTITAVDCTIIRLADKIVPKFFIAFTNTPDYAMQIKKVLSGTTRLRVSRANLGKIHVPLPAIQKQIEFVSIAEQADKSKYIN